MQEVININIGDHDGILAIGDVHGNYSDFLKAVEKAEKENLYLVSLGDIVDYGTNSVETVRLMAKLIAEDKAILIQGNHERKLTRYFIGLREQDVRVKLKGGILKTLEQLEELSKDEFEKFVDLFFWMIDGSPLIAKFKNLRFVHGALEPAYWVSTEKTMRLNGKIRNSAYFGQVSRDEQNDDGFPIRRYDWVNKINKDVIVIVGHDIKSNEDLVIEKNGHGGQVIFTDAGSSKGGRLLSITLKQSEDNRLFELVSHDYY